MGRFKRAVTVDHQMQVACYVTKQQQYEMQVKDSCLRSTQAIESRGHTPSMTLVIRNQKFQDNQSN